MAKKKTTNKKAAQKPPEHLTPGRGKRRATCFECDGSGQMCNVCGSSRAHCESVEDETCVEADVYSECDNCEGSGQVYVDA